MASRLLTANPRPVPPNRRRVGRFHPTWDKRLEQGSPSVFRQTDARTQQRQTAFTGYHRFIGPSSRMTIPHAAIIRELDGVTDEV